MNVLVAGATGNTGKRLVNTLKERGHNPIAMHRQNSDLSGLPSDIEMLCADLTDLPDDVCADCDVVVFAAGSGGNTSEEMTDKIDRDGAIALIDQAVSAGVERFVMLSSIGADQSDPEGELAHYLKAKNAADEYLKAAPIHHAILRPVALTDDDGVGDVELADDVDQDAKAARGDVALTLTHAVDDAAWCDRIAEMRSRSGVSE